MKFPEYSDWNLVYRMGKFHNAVLSSLEVIIFDSSVDVFEVQLTVGKNFCVYINITKHPKIWITAKSNGIFQVARLKFPL